MASIGTLVASAAFAAEQGAGKAAQLAEKAAEAVNATTPPLPQITPALPSSTGWGGYLQAIGVLCFLLAALYFALWFLKRFGKLQGLSGGKLAKDMISVETRYHFAPKKSLVVVRFLDKRLLLGVTDQQITLLSETNADHDTDTAFKDILSAKADSNASAD